MTRYWITSFLAVAVPTDINITFELTDFMLAASQCPFYILDLYVQLSSGG
jgi:hypothetical protein